MSDFSAKKYRFTALTFTFAVVLIYSLCPTSKATPILPSQHIEDLRESILLLAQARDHAVNDYEDLERQNLLDETERMDHQLFIQYLDSRIRVYCGELHELNGLLVPADFPCSFSTGFGRSGDEQLALPAETSSTTDEQIAALDESLDAALGQFDDMLLKEQETLEMHVPSQRETGTDTSREGTEAGNGGREGDRGDEEGQSPQKGDSEQDASSQRGEEQYPSDESRRKGAGAGDGTEATTRESSTQSDRLDASDDDVVARQLREAAEKETDPEIKKKLWEEYRKYKEGTR